MRELVLGGQRSGKSRYAEQALREYHRLHPQAGAVFLATALAADAEMKERVKRHQADRADRLPWVRTVEVDANLGQSLAEATKARDPSSLVVVDCLSLWCARCLAPPPGWAAADWPAMRKEFLTVLGLWADLSKGELLMVSNEIGLGVVPLGRETRHFVDELGRLNQDVAAICERVTLVAAGLPLRLKWAG